MLSRCIKQNCPFNLKEIQIIEGILWEGPIDLSWTTVIKTVIKAATNYIWRERGSKESHPIVQSRPSLNRFVEPVERAIVRYTHRPITSYNETIQRLRSIRIPLRVIGIGAIKRWSSNKKDNKTRTCPWCTKSARKILILDSTNSLYIHYTCSLSHASLQKQLILPRLFSLLAFLVGSLVLHVCKEWIGSGR